MARNQECFSLGARRACRWVPKLEPLMACKVSALCQIRGVQTAFMASLLRAILTCRQGLGLADWYYLLLTSLLARRDVPLMASLKAGKYEVLLRNLALTFFGGEKLKGGKLSEDNSSSAGASASSEIISLFPLLRGTGCKSRSLSCTCLSPRSCFFLPKPYNQSFSCCKISA